MADSHDSEQIQANSVKEPDNDQGAKAPEGKNLLKQGPDDSSANRKVKSGYLTDLISLLKPRPRIESEPRSRRDLWQINGRQVKPFPEWHPPEEMSDGFSPRFGRKVKPFPEWHPPENE
jgi:hypothetical protein